MMKLIYKSWFYITIIGTQLFPANIEDARPGEFAMYQVDAPNCCVLLGILKISRSDYIMRLFDKRSGQESFTVMTKATESGKVILQPKSGDPEAMIQMVFGENLMNFWLHAQRSAGTAKTVESRKRITWPYYKVDHDFVYAEWAPFFGFLDARLTDKKPAFKLIALGHIPNESDVDTFKLFGRYGRNPYGQDVKLEPKSPAELTIGGKRLSLDENWILADEGKIINLTTQIKNEKEGSPAAWIQYERISKNWSLPLLANRIMSSFECVVTEYSDIRPETRRLSLARYISNSMYVRTIVLIYGKPGKYDVIRISTPHDVYENNKEYFDNLINANHP